MSDDVTRAFDAAHLSAHRSWRSFIGCRVASRSVGDRKSFVGRIVDAMRGGLIVEDEHGRRWVRDRKELDWA